MKKTKIIINLTVEALENCNNKEMHSAIEKFLIKASERRTLTKNSYIVFFNKIKAKSVKENIIK